MFRAVWHRQREEKRVSRNVGETRYYVADIATVDRQAEYKIIIIMEHI